MRKVMTAIGFIGISLAFFGFFGFVGWVDSGTGFWQSSVCLLVGGLITGVYLNYEETHYFDD